MRKLIFILQFAFVYINLNAQWISNGPYGGHIISLAIHPTNPEIVFAGCDDSGGIYRSNNGGETWDLLTNLTDISGWTIAIDPNNPDIIYGGDILGLGAYKTSDGGANWAFINNGLSNLHISTIAINPDSSNVVYAGTGGFRFAGNGIFVSSDYGNNWTSTGLNGMNVYFIAINPDSTNIIYAGTHGNGLFKSIDGGANWVQLSLPSLSIMSLTINPDSTNVIYASTFDFTNSVVYKSSDSGISWDSLGLDNLFTWSIAIDPVSSNKLYAATLYGGIYKSINNGMSWTPINSGINTPFGFSIAINPFSPDTLYSGFYAAGVHKSINGGNNWTQKINGIRNTYIFDLLSHPDSSNIIFAPSTYGYNGGSLYVSSDNGINWNSLIPPGNILSTLSLTMNLNDNNIMYSAAIEGTYKSTDQGITWSLIDTFPDNEERVTSIAIDPTTITVIYTAVYITSPDTGIIIRKSNDSGITWNQIGFFQKSTPSVVLHPNSDMLYGGVLSIDPITPNVIYVGTFGGVFKSIDYGINWTFSGLSAENIFALAINPDSTNILYAGCESGKIFKSTDSGINWTVINQAWPSAMITDILIDPNSTNIIYISRDASDWHTGLHGGISVSYDAGMTWSDIESGMSTTHTVSLGINNNSTRLYAGTYGGGVFSKNIINGIEDNAEKKITGNLFNFPNPFIQSTVINYILKETSHATLAIYDLLGQKLYTLVDEQQEKGKHSVVWDGKNEEGNIMPSGIYSCILKLANNLNNNNIILIIKETP